VIPQITEQLESLATSFDAELKDKEADLTQAKHLLATMEGEIETSRTALTEMTKMFQDVDPRATVSEDVVSIGEAVLARLVERVDSLTKNLKTVVERGQARDLALLVREEEQSIPADLQDSKISEEQNLLANELTELQSQRRALVDRIVDIYANTGCGETMVGYRRLIAICIGKSTDQVDGILDQLYQLYMEDVPMSGVAGAGGAAEDVDMTGTD